MQTKKIIIIGAGFAGLTAAKRLASSQINSKITLIAKSEQTEFLPLIPDCLGRGINSKFLSSDILKFCEKFKINFIKAEVDSVDFESRSVFIGAVSYTYDYLIITSGTQTNFFANTNAQKHAFALNNADDVNKIIVKLKENKFDNYLICGGGYTGIETATNLWLYFKKKNFSKKIIVVEQASEILGLLPDWMKSYVRKNLESMGIEILANSVIEDIQEGQIKVSGAMTFTNTMLIWVPGVRTADFIQHLSIDKNPQGRIVVDEYLKVNQNCFCAGDTAFFKDKNNFLRMAIQFAINEGQHVADNVLREMQGRSLKRFKPLDLGYIIPMANNKSCGIVLGYNLKGLLPTVLHFIMCIYRSVNLNNRLGIICNLLKGGDKC